jgi:hypothetical protein
MERQAKCVVEWNKVFPVYETCVTKSTPIPHVPHAQILVTHLNYRFRSASPVAKVIGVCSADFPNDPGDAPTSFFVGKQGRTPQIRLFL